jgi:deoxyribodipyrimidine photo-lyase
MATAIVWFRQDLRLSDNPALQAAMAAGYTPVPVYVHAPGEEDDWRPGAASNTWLHRSLAALDADLRARGSALRYFAGPTLDTLRRLISETNIEAVFWNRRYEPALQARDTAVLQALRLDGAHVQTCNGHLLIEPWEVNTKTGGPYQVFTPFWRAALAALRLPPLWDAPMRFPAIDAVSDGIGLDALGLAPKRNWDIGFWNDRTPGEAGAREALEIFIDGALHGYRSERDRPDRIGTSRLSPHLHFGEIAPWRVVAAVERARTAALSADIDGYVRELGWREFGYHLLHHFPTTTDRNLNPRFDRFAWAKPDAVKLDAWQRGRTGVPIVDAGMRELWHTGAMHNRVRMIVGSYLCKHLRYHWRHGARWFWDTLVDADLANNTMGWQWIGGTGADAAPYFRVFNPVSQAEKFDPNGAYIARWVPELAALPVPARLAPWEAHDLLRRLAPTYPKRPIVDLAQGRNAALAAYQASK